MSMTLERIAAQGNYDDLPETWRVPNDGRFSAGKTLYEYQTLALRQAAGALHKYYKTEGNERQRKFRFANEYGKDADCLAVPQYNNAKNAEKIGDENAVFRILSEYFKAEGKVIPACEFINRMSFWMATGSGKTLVMVKLIEYLQALITHREIPDYNILLLAPSDHLFAQIRRTVDEFNEARDLYINLVPLREMHLPQRQAMARKTITVYYHRSDNISDVQKEAMTDYRRYVNDGKWYVLLDEAHKGGKEDSKRQAYYAIMSQRGFLFNFSATFTDEADIVTTVKKYNLQDFVSNGYGKNIYLKDEYKAFKGADPSEAERKKIVLKSLLTFTYVSDRADQLRERTGLGEKLYHRPLMLTLVNSVNTDVSQNDLWAFFQTLRELAANEVDDALFKEAREELAAGWKNPDTVFGEKMADDSAVIKKITIAAMRQAVFRSTRKGALQYIRSKDQKELAFQLKSADAPFALIRIGNTSKWRNDLLVGYEESTTLQQTSFFDKLSSEESRITILMGSRSFFESWDSNRPNVINFINIGGNQAKKFVVQSVGRGVRIQTLPGVGGRRRLSHLPDNDDTRVNRQKLLAHRAEVQPVESLFLFATNRTAIKQVMDGLGAEQQKEAFQLLTGFELTPPVKISGQEMPLLVPTYAEKANSRLDAPFHMDKKTRNRFKDWLTRTPESVLMVRDGLSPEQIKGLHRLLDEAETDTDKQYASLYFLQDRLLAHYAKKAKVAEGVRKLDGKKDIVHFQNIRVEAPYAKELERHIAQVKEGKPSTAELKKLIARLEKGEIDEEEFDRKRRGENMAGYKDLTIQKLAHHYYMPVIIATSDKVDYIQHIIKVRSEVEFIRALEKHLKEEMAWDAWMFSKLDEYWDEINIPYYEGGTNEYRKFKPDFIFWLCNSKKKEYRIVFVDPKGTAHTQAFSKIDGYEKLFLKDAVPRMFKHKGWKVSVHLLYYNKQTPRGNKYKDYWIRTPAGIFKGASP